MTKRRGTAIAVVATVMGWTHGAGAVPLRDAAFAVDLGDVPICFIVPSSLRALDEKTCEGFTTGTEAQVQEAVTGQTFHVLANGILRAGSEPTMLGLVQVIKVDTPGAWPDEKTATTLVRGVAEGMGEALPKSAAPRIGAVRFETFSGTRVIRSTIDIEGIAETAPVEQRMMQHQEVSIVVARAGTYFVTFSGPRTNAAALKRASDASIRTVTLEAAARPGNDVSRQLGQLFFYVLMAVGAGIAFIVHKRKARAAQR